MNITEFAALKAGDKISNLMAGSTGEVVEVTDLGVKVCWYAGTAPRVYVANSTAWMHWDKIELVIIDPLSKHLAEGEL